MPLTHSTIDSPVGTLTIVADGEQLAAVHFAGHGPDPAGFSEQVSDAHPIAAEQLQEYFAGERTQFDMQLTTRGTEFQRLVWAALQQIPYGTTRSYGEIAAAIGRPTAVRAVGSANNRNTVPIVIPCHRVVGANGALVGYAGGVDIKRWLLTHERALPLTGASPAAGQ